MPPTSVPPPFVSVVLPVRNEGAFLERSLGAVLGQDYPADRFEVLVVDGRSEDATADVARELAARRERPVVRVLDNPLHNAAAGMNRGIEAARGAIVVRVDGHTEVEPTFLTESVRTLLDTEADCAGGSLRTVGEGAVGRALAAAMASPFGVGASAFRTDPGYEGEVDTVPFGAYRREVFERVGLFDERFVRNQDDEFHLRLTAAGGRIVITPRVRTTYWCRPSFAAAWRQFFGYGRWKVAVGRKHGRLPTLRGLVPPVWLLSLSVTVLLGAWFASPWVALAIVGPYALCAVIGALASFRGRWTTLLLLPIAFVVLHAAYGTGFLVGMVADARGDVDAETRGAPA